MWYTFDTKVKKIIALVLTHEKMKPVTTFSHSDWVLLPRMPAKAMQVKSRKKPTWWEGYLRREQRYIRYKAAGMQKNIQFTFRGTS